MKLDRLLKLGDTKLYRVSTAVGKEEVEGLTVLINELFQIIVEYRRKYGSGRAVAAPQVGVTKRIICWNVDKPVVMINPELSDLSESMMELWDDCMSFPGLHVKVLRHVSCTLNFLDKNWRAHTWKLERDKAELIQHEIDHLDGILATQRAIDDRSFMFKG